VNVYAHMDVRINTRIPLLIRIKVSPLVLIPSLLTRKIRRST
jgi:hypothetical protein